jgi:hypothetical protein
VFTVLGSRSPEDIHDIIGKLGATARHVPDEYGSLQQKCLKKKIDVIKARGIAIRTLKARA